MLAFATGGCRKGEPARPAAPTIVSTAKPGPPPRGKAIALLYSSNLLGAYAPCACALPLGGIARRATLIARARVDADAVLIVDAGDLFAPADPARDAGDSERGARLMAEVTVRAGLTAFTPGERDLALGVSALRRVAAAAGLPITTANLYGSDGQRLFEADRLVDAAGVKVGLFGVSAPATPADAARWRAAGIEVRDPADAAREAVRSLRARGAAVVVALVHVGAPAESRRLVAAVDGIDWVVLGHSGLNLEAPEKVGGARLLEAMSEGRDLGRLDLHLVGDGLAFADRGERAEIADILADHRRQLTEYDRPLGDTDPASLLEYRDSRRRQLQQAIDRESALLARLPEAITGSWFENQILALGPGIPDEPAIAKLIGDPPDGGTRSGSHRPGRGHRPGRP
jgi:2',3'-cyclic-nucleotide 2'-phosphodiesterase (5'-nucleotidase family)